MVTCFVLVWNMHYTVTAWQMEKQNTTLRAVTSKSKTETQNSSYTHRPFWPFSLPGHTDLSPLDQMNTSQNDICRQTEIIYRTYRMLTYTEYVYNYYYKNIILPSIHLISL